MDHSELTFADVAYDRDVIKALDYLAEIPKDRLPQTEGPFIFRVRADLVTVRFHGHVIPMMIFEEQLPTALRFLDIVSVRRAFLTGLRSAIEDEINRINGEIGHYERNAQWKAEHERLGAPWPPMSISGEPPTVAPFELISSLSILRKAVTLVETHIEKLRHRTEQTEREPIPEKGETIHPIVQDLKDDPRSIEIREFLRGLKSFEGKLVWPNDPPGARSPMPDRVRKYDLPLLLYHAVLVGILSESYRSHVVGARLFVWSDQSRITEKELGKKLDQENKKVEELSPGKVTDIIRRLYSV